MIPNTTYKINFLDENDKVIRTLSFPLESQRDALYNSIDSIDHYLVPAGAVRVEKEKVERVSALYQPRRRSVISGRYKGGAY